MVQKSEATRPVVIVVDDDAAVRNSLEFSLGIEGFATRAFASAGDLLRSPEPGCACYVIDHNLPGMSGFDLITTLRGRHFCAPAILITTHPSAILVERATRAGIPVIEKPLLGNALVDKIFELCALP